MFVSLTDLDLLVLHFPKSMQFNEAQFFDFCVENRELHIERTVQGDFEIMSPTGGITGNRNLMLAAQLYNWAIKDNTGVGFDSSTGFVLPNGAIRSPDISWVKKSRLTQLTLEQKRRFLPLCPDFIIELRSPTDSLKTLQAKMNEYMDNGASLGWLINPQHQQVFIFQAKKDIVILDNPEFLMANELLSGFKLVMQNFWEVSF